MGINPLAPWLHSSYYSRYFHLSRPEYEVNRFKAARFPALLALVDMIPSLLNVVAYLEQYHLADAEDNQDSPEHQLQRFEQYLRIPSLKPLCQIHGITKAQGLWGHLAKELHARGQFELGKKVPTYQLSATRRKELGFWFNPYEVFFSQLYGYILEDRTDNNKQDAVTAESVKSVKSFDGWFNPKEENIKVDEIIHFYRYGPPTVGEI